MNPKCPKCGLELPEILLQAHIDSCDVEPEPEHGNFAMDDGGGSVNTERGDEESPSPGVGAEVANDTGFLHGGFRDLLADLAEPGFEGCCLVRGLGIEDGGNLP